MKNLGLENVEEIKMDFKNVTPGGYIAEIKSVFDNADKEILEVELDIFDGEFKGYYQDLYDKKGFWGLKKHASYKEKAKPFFKAMITSIEESNLGYKFNYDEKTLIGKKVGLVLGEEEYEGNNGAIKKRIYIDRFRSIEAIASGDFKVPALKELKKDFTSSETVADEDLPF